MHLADLIIGGGIGSILVALVNALINRRKLGADTASVLSKAAADLVEPLSKRIKELEVEVDRLRSRVHAATIDLDTCQASNRAKDRTIADLIARGVAL